jgi:hypothetical protein
MHPEYRVCPKGRGERITRTFAAFKAAYKAKDVQDIAQDLERTLNLQSAVMIAKMKSVSSYYPQHC